MTNNEFRNDVDTEADFHARYIQSVQNPTPIRRVVEVDGDAATWVHIKDSAGRSLWLDVRQVCIGEDDQHLCVDVHTFVDGVPATTAMWSIVNGNRVTLPDTGHTSLGWPSAHMPILIVGAQATT